MPANTVPIFPLTPLVGWKTLTSANTATDGTGTANTLVTAGANGARIDRVRCVPAGSNVATVLRLFVNNGSTNATPANNTLLMEIALPATSASPTVPNGQAIDIPLGIALPAGYKLNAVIATAVSAGWHVTAEGGDY